MHDDDHDIKSLKRRNEFTDMHLDAHYLCVRARCVFVHFKMHLGAVMIRTIHLLEDAQPLGPQEGLIPVAKNHVGVD